MTVLPIGSEQKLELFKVGYDHILGGFYQTSCELFRYRKGKMQMMKNIGLIKQPSERNALFKAHKKGLAVII